MTQEAPSRQRLEDGERGEYLARKYLESDGWECLGANFATERGEIDLIVEKWLPRDDVSTIAFVEVKSRNYTDRFAPERSVTHRKRRTITRVAREYVAQHLPRRAFLRFDVIAVDLGQTPPGITHFPGAFDANGEPY